MATMSDHPAQRVELHSERLVTHENDPLEKGDGLHPVRTHEGIQISAEVRNGEIVGYQATRNGESVETFQLTKEPGQAEMRRVCFECIILPEGWACWEIAC